MINSVAVRCSRSAVEVTVAGGYGLAGSFSRSRCVQTADPDHARLPIAFCGAASVTFINWNLYDSVLAVALVHTPWRCNHRADHQQHLFWRAYDSRRRWTLGYADRCVHRVALRWPFPASPPQDLHVGFDVERVFAASILTVQNHTLPARCCRR